MISPTSSATSSDQHLWKIIRDTSARLGWSAYVQFIDEVMSPVDTPRNSAALPGTANAGLQPPNGDTYFILKGATETFVARNCAGLTAAITDDSTADTDVVQRSPQLYLVEMFWCYWHEVGMLAATVDRLAQCVQEPVGNSGTDALAALRTEALLPARDLLLSYLQDVASRLSFVQRQAEYKRQYGLLAPSPGEKPFVSHLRFSRAFSKLLLCCAEFYKELDNSTIVADGLPVLYLLQEVHFILAESMEYHYGEIARRARQEMLVRQWILDRPEVRAFLPRRIMVPYPERWMGSADAMNALLGWTDTSTFFYRRLAVFGERLLLSIRFGRWDEGADMESARNWAMYWRPEILGYLHAYRAVMKVDLSAA